MQLSIAIFIVSLLLHVVILLHWKRYKNHSPLAYALTQPMAHSIILVIALSVGAVDRCAPEATRYSGGPLRDIPAIKNPGHFNQ